MKPTHFETKASVSWRDRDWLNVKRSVGSRGIRCAG